MVVASEADAENICITLQLLKARSWSWKVSKGFSKLSFKAGLQGPCNTACFRATVMLLNEGHS